MVYRRDIAIAPRKHSSKSTYNPELVGERKDTKNSQQNFLSTILEKAEVDSAHCTQVS